MFIIFVVLFRPFIWHHYGSQRKVVWIQRRKKSMEIHNTCLMQAFQKHTEYSNSIEVMVFLKIIKESIFEFLTNPVMLLNSCREWFRYELDDAYLTRLEVRSPSLYKARNSWFALDLKVIWKSTQTKFMRSFLKKEWNPTTFNPKNVRILIWPCLRAERYKKVKRVPSSRSRTIQRSNFTFRYVMHDSKAA